MYGDKNDLAWHVIYVTSFASTESDVAIKIVLLHHYLSFKLWTITPEPVTLAVLSKLWKFQIYTIFRSSLRF